MSRKPPGAIGLALLTWLAAATAAAAPSRVRTSYFQPAATSVGIAWSTLAGTPEAQVQYGTTPGSYPATAQGTVSASTAPYGATSTATLTGLTPSTTYYFRVGGPQGGWSPEHTVRTGPAEHPQCGTFRFVAIGDSRAQTASKAVSDTFPLLLQHMLQHENPAFILHSGDLLENGNEAAQWATMLQVTAPYSTQAPIMYAMGNHDDGPVQGDGAHYNQVLHLPRGAKALGGSGTEDHYFFTYANAIFVVLSTQTFEGGTPAFQNQADWMDKVLTQHPKRWKFVVLHHPIYTLWMFINHAPNERGQNAALVPVLNKHHVDMVFQGHNHFYERWAPSACQNGASSTPCPVASYDQGTVFITSGGGGAFPHLLVGGTGPARLAASAAHHYVSLEIQDHKLSLRTIDGTGKVIDTLSIAKPTTAPDPCLAPPKDSGPPDAAPPKDSKVATDAPGLLDLLLGDHVPPPGDLPAPGREGTTPPSSDGCSCRVGGSSGPDGVPLLLLAGLLLLLLLRRRLPLTAASPDTSITTPARDHTSDRLFS